MALKTFITIILFLMVSLELVSAELGIQFNEKENLQIGMGSKSKYPVVYRGWLLFIS